MTKKNRTFLMVSEIAQNAFGISELIYATEKAGTFSLFIPLYINWYNNNIAPIYDDIIIYYGFNNWYNKIIVK